MGGAEVRVVWVLAAGSLLGWQYGAPVGCAMSTSIAVCCC